MDPEEIDILSAIKRSAVVLLLLARLGRSAGEKEIAGLLKMNQETVRYHLRSLHNLGLISRNTQHNGYSLTRSGKKLAPIDNAENPRKSAEYPRNYAENPRFGRSTTSSALNSRKIEYRKAVAEGESHCADNPRKYAENPRESAEFPRFHGKEVIHRLWIKRNKLSGVRATQAISALEAANLAALRAEGLGSNHRVQRVCRLPHVTPQYIAGQARRLRQEHRFAATLLLHIVESGDPLPSDRDDDSEREDRLRYITGKYADIIQH